MPYHYPLAPSQVSNATALELISFVKSPTLIQRRMSELVQAKEFLSFFLLTGRYTITGGAIAYPVSDNVETSGPPEDIAPGAEYSFVTLTEGELEILTSGKRGFKSRFTDEAITRRLRQPIDEGLVKLKISAKSDIEDTNLGAVQSAITQAFAGNPWTSGKDIVKNVLKAKTMVTGLRLGYEPDTVVIPETMWADTMAEVLDVLPQGDKSVITGAFPDPLGMDWVTTSDGSFTDPMLIDRKVFGGIAREQIISPEYRPVGDDTGIEIATHRTDVDATDVHLRYAQLPVVLNPNSAIRITGHGL